MELIDFSKIWNTSYLNRPSIEKVFMQIVLILSTRSSCAKGSVGSIIVKDSRIISMGWNGPPSKKVSDYICLGKDNCIVDGNNSCLNSIHSEQNAIAFAARNGISTIGCDMYCNWTPCLACAKILLQSGIKRFFYLREYRDLSGLEFLKNNKVETIKL